jgi:hypothetical protein
VIYIVSGAPCAGKSTYIRENAKSGSIVIDMDRIALALTTEDTEHHDYSDLVKGVAIMARRAAIAKALPLGQALDVFIIDTDPSKENMEIYSRYRANWVRLDPGYKTVIERIRKERPIKLQPRLMALANKFYGVSYG